jgi:hypothetical protein
MGWSAVITILLGICAQCPAQSVPTKPVADGEITRLDSEAPVVPDIGTFINPNMMLPPRAQKEQDDASSVIGLNSDDGPVEPSASAVQYADSGDDDTWATSDTQVVQPAEDAPDADIFKMEDSPGSHPIHAPTEDASAAGIFKVGATEPAEPAENTPEADIFKMEDSPGSHPIHAPTEDALAAGIMKVDATEPDSEVTATESHSVADYADYSDTTDATTAEAATDFSVSFDENPFMSRPPTSAPKVIQNQGSTMSIQTGEMDFDCLAPCIEYWAKNTAVAESADPVRGRNLVKSMLGNGGSDPLCDTASPTSDYHLCEFFTQYSNTDGKCSAVMDQDGCSGSETHALRTIESFCSGREDANELLTAVTCKGKISSFAELEAMSGDDEAEVEDDAGERLDCVAGCNILYMVDHFGSTSMYDDCKYYSQYLFGDTCKGMGVPNADMCPGTEFTALKFVDTWCSMHNSASDLSSILAPNVGSSPALGCLTPCFEYFTTDNAGAEVQDPCSYLASFIEEYAPQDSGKCAQAGVASQCSEQSIAGTYALVESTLNNVCSDLGIDTGGSASPSTEFKIAPISADHLAKAKVGEVIGDDGRSDGALVSGEPAESESATEQSVPDSAGTSDTRSSPSATSAGANTRSTDSGAVSTTNMGFRLLVLFAVGVALFGVYVCIMRRNNGGGATLKWKDPDSSDVLAGSNVSIL